MTDSNGNIVMPVAPMGGGYGDAGLFGGQSGWWIILLLLCLGGGWGNGFGGFGGGAMPWMMGAQTNTNNDIQRGFDQSALISGINSVQNTLTSGFGDVQTALCGGFGSVNAAIANGFAQSEIAANARQLADLQQSFAVQSALQNCCCENRANIADLKYTVGSENCADRQALSDGIRDILTNQNNGIQRILDQMCSDKIDSKNEKIADLERQIAALNSNNYIQNALSAQTQYFLALYPTTTGAVAKAA